MYLSIVRSIKWVIANFYAFFCLFLLFYSLLLINWWQFDRFGWIYGTRCGGVPTLFNILWDRHHKCTIIWNVRAGISSQSNFTEFGPKYIRRAKQFGVFGYENFNRSPWTAEMQAMCGVSVGFRLLWIGECVVFHLQACDYFPSLMVLWVCASILNA